MHCCPLAYVLGHFRYEVFLHVYMRPTCTSSLAQPSPEPGFRVSTGHSFQIFYSGIDVVIPSIDSQALEQSLDSQKQYHMLYTHLKSTNVVWCNLEQSSSTLMGIAPRLTLGVRRC
jgi:hypothetical protein